MADKYPKSKLKRKKSTVDEHQADIYQKTTFQKLTPRDHNKDLKTDSSKQPAGVVSPTEAWWTRNDQNPSEQLWAVTLETVLPRLGSGIWDPLPKPSTVTPRPSEQQYSLPASEVPPFPEPSRRPGSPLQSPPSPPLPISSRPPAVEHPSPAGPRVTPSHGGGEIQVPETTAARGPAAPPHRRKEEDRYSEPPVTRKEAAGVGRESAAEKTQRGSEDLAKRQISTFPLWSGPITTTTTTTAKKARLVMPSMVHTLTSSGERRADRTETTMQAGERVEALEVAGPSGAGREGGSEGDGGGGGGRGGEGLQCCPMCTLVFPKRFSQMECDSHLAQCLSEMNVDMAW